MNMHCKGVVKRHPLQTAGGVQQLRVLTEGDMYRLMTHSQLMRNEAADILMLSLALSDTAPCLERLA
jgi:prophage antirepressor-like protein